MAMEYQRSWHKEPLVVAPRGTVRFGYSKKLQKAIACYWKRKGKLLRYKRHARMDFLTWWFRCRVQQRNLGSQITISRMGTTKRRAVIRWSETYWKTASCGN